VISEPVFVGRDGELAVIASCAQAAAADQAQVVWIEGDAGAGKTALVQEAVARLPPAYHLLRAAADELAPDVPFGTLAGLGLAAAGGAFAAGVELVALLAAAQDAGPVALVVEDMHWADGPSRQALLTAARRLHDDKVMLLMTSRPDAGAADGWERFCLEPGQCRRIVLESLSRAEVTKIAQAVGKPLTSRHAERLHQHTQGHALYVRTLLAELSAEQLSAPDGQLPAPRSLALTTVATLAGLPADARLLAAALSVVNQRTPLSIVGHIASLAEPTRALEGILGTGFVTWRPADLQTPIEFVHPLYRAAVYEDLSPTRRQALHRAAGQVLEAGTALAHRVAAADRADDGLADEAEAAAARALERGALARAATCLLWAAPLSSSSGHRERRLLTAMRLLLADGQTARAAGLRDQAMACSPGPLRSLVLGTLALDQGEAAAAELWLARVSAADHADGGADDQGPPDAGILAAALCSLGSLYVNQGRAAEAAPLATRALALTPPDPELERAAWSVRALSEGMLRGAPAGLDRLAGRLPGTAEAVSGADASLLVVRGTLGFYAGRTTAATTDLRSAIRIASQNSAAPALPRAHLRLAQLLLSSGDWEEALLHARLAQSLISDERQMWTEAQAHAILATLTAYQGRWEAAAEHVRAARDAALTLETVEAVFTSRIAQAALARARGEPAGVIDSLGPLAGQGDVRAIPMLSSLGWWPTLIEATIESGDAAAAAVQVDQLTQAAADRRLNFQARVLGLQARLAQARGQLGQAASLFQQALGRFGADDPVLDRALLQLALSRLLRAQGDRRHALEHFRAVHQTLTEMGAEPFRQRMTADLTRSGQTRSGQRPAAQRRPDPLELTEREQDVVALVAKGLANREVAAELYVSEKAVEYHLSNIFGKLGISSRRELRNRTAS
jgi:ATP/maltotriose-dependent transcriptional regulator MalT